MSRRGARLWAGSDSRERLVLTGEMSFGSFRSFGTRLSGEDTALPARPAFTVTELQRGAAPEHGAVRTQ